MIDSDYPTKVFLRQAKAIGKQPGRDFDLISVDTIVRRDTDIKDMLHFYYQQPEKMGRQAWKMLFKATSKIPYSHLNSVF